MALRPSGNVAQESPAVGVRRQTVEVATGHGAASLSTTEVFTNAHDTQIVNSNLTVAGGDINNQVHHHYHYERKRDIRTILQAIPNFRDIYHDMLEKATPGTGMWLVKGNKFRVWLEPNGDIKIFWGSGIPGAGKTVLASIVINYLELRKESSGPICVCYVYFRYSQREEVTVRNVLETFVKQTLERHPSCQALVERTYAQHLKEGSEPTVAQLVGLLQELADCMVCMFFVLDALDEAPTKIQLAVVKTLAMLNVKIFITSRPLETVQAKFPLAHTTAILAQDTDLDLHIAKAIDESADLQYLLDHEDPSLQEEIVSTIKQNCGGMFLHASLQLDALSECISAQQVRRTLKAFPSKIEDVYLFTWDRILKQTLEHVSLAKAVLVWVLNASRSMTVEELARAVATSPESHKFQTSRVVHSTILISLCCGLVTVEEESRRVHLVHYTAKNTLEDLLRPEFSRPHSLLAAVCMTHLAECGFQNTMINSKEEFKAVLKNDPLLAYATEAWTFHACSELHVEETKHQTMEFIKGCHAFPAFTYYGRLGFDILTPLHIVGLYKLPVALIEGALLDSSNLTTKLGQQSPLVFASQFGHEDLVSHIIALPETQVNLVDGVGFSALMQAAWIGHDSIVKILLAHPGIQVNSVASDGSSALMRAAWAGQDSVVKILLAYPGIQVNLVDIAWFSALMRAARARHDSVVKILLAHPGIQVNLVDKDGWSALMRAAWAGHDSVVKILLAHPEIQINLVDSVGQSALLGAASYGREGVVKALLVCPEVHVNLADHHGSTALLLAAEDGYNTIVELLLATGSFDVNVFDHDGDTAIKMAAHNGHEAIVHMLLGSPNVDISIRSTRDGHTAMSGAQDKGHIAIVELLQDFESQRTVNGRPTEIGQLSLHNRTDEESSNSDSDEAYYDAEEGEDEDVTFSSSIPG